MAVGALASLTVLGAFSLYGLIALPVALLLAWPVSRVSRGAGTPGIVSGLGLPCLYVVYLNRRGPGNVCTVHADGSQACIQEYNPLIWAVIAVLFLAAGLAVFLGQRRQSRKARALAGT